VVWTRSDNRLTDLKEMHLQASMEGKSLGQAFGALIFTCNGRGRNLFNELSYDSRKIAEFIPVPSSGFLCNGKAMPIKASQQLCSGEQLSVSQNMKT
jgi:small ligand-binding sensory domain FIST